MNTGGGRDVFVHATVLGRPGLLGGQKVAFDTQEDHHIRKIAVGNIQQLVRHLTNRGIGVLITDHNVRETLGLTDRAYIVYAGQILTEGSPEEIVADPDVRRLYLGEEFRL